MTSGQLRVLYLTTPDPAANAVAAQSFVAEEIAAIRSERVTPLVLSDACRGTRQVDEMQLIGAPRATNPAQWRWLLPVMLRNAPTVRAVLRRASAPAQVRHALRIEALAAAVVRREGIQLIHSHFGWPGGFGGCLAARVAGVPLIANLRGTDILVTPETRYGLRLDPGYDAAIGHLLRRADCIQVATAFMQREAERLGAAPARLTRLEKGVDAGRFRPPANRDTAKASLGLAGVTVLAAGSLIPRKGFDLLLDAFADCRHDDLTLVICGEGRERRALEAHAVARGIGARVRFAGHVSRQQMAAYFSAADIFVHAAELEAAGNVVLEALASGCAVVVTDSGGPPEYVEDGVNGVVVPVRDERALRHALDALTGSPALRRQLAAEGRRRIEMRHTYTRMMADQRAIYDRVLGAFRAAPRIAVIDGLPATPQTPHRENR